MHEVFSYRSPKPRVTVIGGMMAYFESIMEPGFRDDRRKHVSAITEPLKTSFNFTELGLWADESDCDRMANKIAKTPCDVVLLIPTMATPPAEIVALAVQCGAPVVIACGHGLSDISETYDMRQLVRHSSNVGATMIGSMMRRLPNPLRPILVTGFLDDPEFHKRVSLAVKTAALAKRFKGLRIGRLGMPMPGYDHIGLSAKEAAASGFELVDIQLKDWAARVSSITENDIRSFQHEILPHYIPPQTVYAPSSDLDRATRLAIALDGVAMDYKLDCGSITCRGPFGVELEQGAISCLATSLMTGSGRPFSATGDIVTSIAMLVGKVLGGATLYCELDAIDRNRDAFLVANTGEGDFGWCPHGGKAEIHSAFAHSGRNVPGVVLNHDISAGPATMIGIAMDRTVSERLSLIALQGETLEPANTALKVTHAWFKPTIRPAPFAFEAWANAGATHHGALSRGNLVEALNWLGMIHDLPVTQITS